MFTESTASGGSAISIAVSNKDITDSPTSPLPQDLKGVRLLSRDIINFVITNITILLSAWSELLIGLALSAKCLFTYVV